MGFEMAFKGFPRWFTRPPVLYGLVSLAAFSRCLFLGQAYFDNDLLAQFGPWRAFLRDQLSQGHFPLWNPYLLGGQPFFADLQNMLLYPVNWITLPFSVPYGLGAFFFIHFFLAAWGMHLWLKSWGLSENACRVGALVYASSNFFWWEIIHPPVLAAFAWLPWLFLCLELLARGPKPLKAFASGLCFSLLFLCGSLQVTLGALYGGALYFSFRFFQRRGSFLPFDFRRFLFLSLFFLGGSLPLLGQFIPTLEFSRLSERYANSQTIPPLSETASLNPASLYQFAFPRLGLEEGRSIDNAVQETNQNRFLSNYGYLGPWFLFLAALAFRGKERQLPFLGAGLCLASCLVALGSYFPVYRYLSFILPGLSLVQVPYRYLYLYVLGGAALAALGFEALLNLPAKRLRPVLQGGLAYGLVLYAIALIQPSKTVIETASLVAGAAGLGLLLWRQDAQKYGRCLFLAAVLLPLFWTGLTDFKPGDPSNFDFEKNSAPLETALQGLGPYRAILDFLHMDYPLKVRNRNYISYYPQDAACALTFKNFGGYNPLHLDSTAKLRTLPLEALVPLMGIREVISGVEHGPIPGFIRKSAPHLYWYEHQKPLSYLFAPDRLWMTDFTGLQRPDFNPSQAAVCSDSLPPEWTKGLGESKPVQGISRVWSYGKPCKLQYQFTLDEPDLQRFDVTLDQDRILVFPEVMYPGWKAWVDGEPSALLTADYCLRSLLVPTGHHEVEFRFEPDWWLPIRVGLGLWLLGTTAGFWIALRPKRRRRA